MVRTIFIFFLFSSLTFYSEPSKLSGLDYDLIRSATRGDISEVRKLLQRGASANARHELTGWTPLIAASLYGHADIVKELIASGADVNAKDKNGATPLMKAVVLGPYTELGVILKSKAEIIKLLLEAGADAQVKDNLKGAPWEMAIIQGHMELIRPFEEANVIGVRETRLQQAIASGNSLLVKELIDQGADVEHIDSDGWSAFSEAALAGNSEILSAVMKHVTDVNLVHQKGWTALMVASERGNADSVRIILDAGADPALKNSDGMNAQMIAARKGHTAVVQLLQNQ